MSSGESADTSPILTALVVLLTELLAVLLYLRYMRHMWQRLEALGLTPTNATALPAPATLLEDAVERLEALAVPGTSRDIDPDTAGVGGGTEQNAERNPSRTSLHPPEEGDHQESIPGTGS